MYPNWVARDEAEYRRSPSPPTFKTPLAMPQFLPYLSQFEDEDEDDKEYSHPFAAPSQVSRARSTRQARSVCAPDQIFDDEASSHTLISGSDSRPETPRPTPTQLDRLHLVAPIVRSSTPSTPLSDRLSDNDHHYYTPSSSAESFESDTIGTPWRHSVMSGKNVSTSQLTLTIDTAMIASSRPSSIVCTTDGEADQPVWSPGRKAKPKKLYLSSSPRQSSSTRRVSSAPASPRARPWSSCSEYSQSSTTDDQRTSIATSIASGPSIHIAESPVDSRFSLSEAELLAPPLSSFVRPSSPSNDSVATLRGKKAPDSTPKKPTHAVTALSSPPINVSPPEPSPIARSRRLNALRGLVSNLDFQQPWSVIDKSEAEHNAFWPAEGNPPQLNRLSLGSSFLNMVDDVAAPASVPLQIPQRPSSSAASAKSSRSPNRFGRSFTSLVNRWDESHMYAAPDSPGRRSEPPPSPPDRSQILASPAPSPKIVLSTSATEEPAPATTISRPGLRKSASFRSLVSRREHPKPPPQRKETFGALYSGYTKAMRPVTPVDVEAATTWRAFMGPQVYDQLVSGPDGAEEIKRQDVMWEMCETEAAFVRSCRDVLRLFASPLRVVGGEWMSGIPQQVTQLFESLETIADTHADLARNQDAARKASDVLDVGVFVSLFAGWVSRLSCHEKYIVLFNPVSQLVEDMARDDKSTFGEFLRMQSTDKALGSLSLGSMLLKPVQRLTKYPLFLRQLCKATPESHSTHADLVSLIDATETILGKLESGKAQEDDLQQLVALAEQLDDLDADFELATRGRRLVAHAQVVRLEDKPPAGMTRSSSIRALRHSLGSAVKSSSRSTPASSTAASTPGGGDTPATIPSRSNSGSASIAESQVGSIASSSSASSSSLYITSRPGSPVRHSRPHSGRSSLHPGSTFGDPTHPPPKASVQALRKARPDVLTLLVFNDLVLLAAPVDRGSLFKSRKAEPVRLRVLSPQEGGIGSVDDLKEIKGWGGHSRAFTLGLQPPAGGPSTIVATYALAPAGSGSGLSRRAHRLAGSPLSGPSLETLDDVIKAVGMARQDVGEVGAAEE